MTSLSIQRIKQFLKETFLIGLVVCLPVYAWVRLIFFEVPFSFSEDITTLFKVVVTGWMLMIALKGAFYLILGAATEFKKRERKLVFRRKWAISFVAVCVLCTLLYACTGH